MTATLVRPKSAAGEEPRFVLDGLSWEQYLAIGDALAERPGLRMTFLDGSLTLVSKSDRHEWLAEFFGYAVVAIAIGCDIDCRAAGGTTFRRRERESGVEGDKTFYFTPKAATIRRRGDLDTEVPPPPDLAIEVEVTHPADEAMVIWGRLGVAEVWRFDEAREALSFWALRPDGTYSQVDRSRFLPMIEPRELVDLIAIVEELGLTRGVGHIIEWSRDVLRPRMQAHP